MLLGARLGKIAGAVNRFGARKMKAILLFALLWTSSLDAAPFMRPPAFLGGIPGRAQFQAIQLQRHQARTLLYREALEELRKNPHAADVPDCPAGKPATGALCLTKPVQIDTIIPPPVVIAAPAVSVAPVAPVTVVPVTPAAPVATPPLSQPVTTPPVASPVEKPLRHKIAVLFGINGYKDPIPELGTPVADVEGIAEALRKHYGYETRILRNVGKKEIIQELNQIAADAKADDSVLLFYAGHGYLMEDTQMGYWIPIDGSVKTAANWISNSDISKLLAAINARQLILVSDSCFSGSLTREQKMTSGVSNVTGVLQHRSVLAFSSGGEEPVSDGGKDGHSIFAWSFINTLKSTNGVAPGFEIYRVVHGQVMKDFPQEPQYGAVISAGHTAGGEYIFEAAN
jgi:hypothetical protein